jgi:hypothetical protein
MGQHGLDSDRKFSGCGLLSSAACFRNAEGTPFFGFSRGYPPEVDERLRRVIYRRPGNLRQSEIRFPQPALRFDRRRPSCPTAFLRAWRGYPGKGLLATLIPTPMLMPVGTELD